MNRLVHGRPALQHQACSVFPSSLGRAPQVCSTSNNSGLSSFAYKSVWSVAIGRRGKIPETFRIFALLQVSSLNVFPTVFPFPVWTHIRHIYFRFGFYFTIDTPFTTIKYTVTIIVIKVLPYPTEFFLLCSVIAASDSCFCITHVHCIPVHTNSGCGKRDAHKNWSMAKAEKAASVTGTTLRLCLCWQLRDPIDSGPDPVVVGGMKMDAVAESGKNSVSKTRFSLSVENLWADAGRDGRTRLARPNSQARTGTGKKSFSTLS